MTSAVNVVGVGAVTGYGWSRSDLWDGLKSGRSAAKQEPLYGLDGGPGWVARIAESSTTDPMAPTRFTQAMRAVVAEAIEDATERGWRPGRRVGLVHATVMGDLDMAATMARGGEGFSKRDYLNLTPSTAISVLMTQYGFHGPATTVGAMCTSGLNAVLTAKSWLDAETVDDVIVVATDLSATPDIVGMFLTLGTAVTDTEPLVACRPFQKDTRGFVFAEGAAALVLSRTRHASAYTAVLGGAMTHDGFHPTSVDPGYAQVRRCFEEALTDAQVDPQAVSYLAAHGPGTRQCDGAESAVAAEVIPQARIYSVKPLVGHCQAASGAVELAVVAMSYEQKEIPAATLYTDPINDQVISGLAPMSGGIVAKSSLGMGGHNAVVLLGEPG